MIVNTMDTIDETLDYLAHEIDNADPHAYCAEMDNIQPVLDAIDAVPAPDRMQAWVQIIYALREFVKNGTRD